MTCRSTNEPDLDSVTSYEAKIERDPATLANKVIAYYDAPGREFIYSPPNIQKSGWSMDIKQNISLVDQKTGVQVYHVDLSLGLSVDDKLNASVDKWTLQ